MSEESKAPGVSRPAPYPADTRAKGWRLELDYERIEQSDTWDLAGEVPMAAHALLMMWYQAWKQVPCGSFPADEAAIRAKCRVPAALWEELKPILMRGWWLADDGRLYHDTVVERVLEMLGYRQKEADRRNRNRRLNGGDRPDAGGAQDGAGSGPAGSGPAPGGAGGADEYGTPIVPELSRGTYAVHRRDNLGSPDTGTGTGTYVTPTLVAKDEKSSTHRSARVSKKPKPGESPGIEVPTAADVFGARLLTSALDRAGVTGVGQDDRRLIELARAQVMPDELEGAARAAVRARAEHPLPWAIARISAQRREAQAVAIGGPPGAPIDPDSREAIEADGVRFEIGLWVPVDNATGKITPWPVYKAKVVKARQADVAQRGGA